MAKQKKFWFLVPGWDTPPAALSLGDILADPTRPHWQLNSTTLTPSHNSTFHTALPPSYSTPFKSKSTKLDLWTQFLQRFGLGAEAAVLLGLENNDRYRYDSLLSEWFSPSVAFVKKAVEDDGVERYLEFAGLGKPLFVVTGLKHVTGVSLSTKGAKTRGMSGKLALDATAVGAPVSVGPEVEVEREHYKGVQWRCEGPIVFAFQLHRVRLRRAGVDVKDHVKGDLLVDGLGELHDDDIDDLEDVDIRAGVYFGVAILHGNGEECTVIAPVVGA